MNVDMQQNLFGEGKENNMIKIENEEVLGWEHAIRGMRNPMNSWGKSDSFICKGGYDFDDCKGHHKECIRHEDFSEDVFTAEEKDVLYAVLNKFRNFTGKSIAEYMHEELAYRQTREYEIIPFYLAKQIRPF